MAVCYLNWFTCNPSQAPFRLLLSKALCEPSARRYFISQPTPPPQSGKYIAKKIHKGEIYILMPPLTFNIAKHRQHVSNADWKVFANPESIFQIRISFAKPENIQILWGINRWYRNSADGMQSVQIFWKVFWLPKSNRMICKISWWSWVYMGQYEKCPDNLQSVRMI